jgi:inner membrane peptidase. Serine peptidase. MEROPS family S49
MAVAPHPISFSLFF